MRKVKTIKKLPKYTGGGVVSLAEPIPTTLNEPEQISKFRMNERKRIYQNYFNPQNNSTGLKNDIQHTVDDASQKAAIGFQLGGPWGAAAGVASSILLGELDNGGHINADGSYELSSGFTRLFGVGRSDESIKREAGRVRTSNIAMQQTANLQANYKNDPRIEVQPPVLAKDGGVIPELIHAKVSKGELYYDPYNKTLSRVPGSPDKPNIDDNVDAFLAKGGMVVTNNDKQPLINGKTQAIALAPMVDKPNKNMSKGTIEARDRIIKKVTHLNELSKIENNKTDGVVYAKDGDPDVGNVISANDLNWYNDIYLNKNTDPSSNKYNDWFYSTLAMIDSGNFEEYNKLQNMYATLGFTDTKPGSKIKKSDAVETYQGMFDNMTDINAIISNLYDTGRLKGRGGSTDKREVWRDGLPGSATWLRHLGKNVDEKTLAEMNANLNKRGVEAYLNPKNGMVNYRHHISHPEFAMSKKQVDEALFGTPQFSKQNTKKESGNAVTPVSTNKKGSDKKGIDFSWAENILDRIPLLAAYLNKPKYHIEEPQTWIPKFRPVAVDITPHRRAIDDSMAIARYNQAHINPNTGAGMAYGLQAANNRAKQLADVYSYQTNAQNELIGQNVGIYNQWAPQTAAARYQAIADTRANEAAADAQRDMNIRDAISYLRDEQIKPFLKQYLSSGAYNKSIKKLN